MENNATTPNTGAGIDLKLKSATPVTPLQLNGIRLGVRHTVLTPDYLENLIQAQPAVLPTQPT